MQITTSEFAELIETTPRNARKFLRADFRERGIATPGKGSRWGIEKRDIKSLTSRFKKWNAAQMEMRANRLADAAKNAANDADSEESNA
jgi:hypothetical protein